MGLKGRLPALSVTAILLGGLAVIVWRLTSGSSGAATVDVEVPRLSSEARAGEAAFEANCAECHGTNAAGTDKGPPLVHDIYNPGHHADAAFLRAVRQGTPQHHWPYGNMPPQPRVSDREVQEIIRYVRELQEANGIVYKPHSM